MVNRKMLSAYISVLIIASTSGMDIRDLNPGKPLNTDMFATSNYREQSASDKASASALSFADIDKSVKYGDLERERGSIFSPPSDFNPMYWIGYSLPFIFIIALIVWPIYLKANQPTVYNQKSKAKVAAGDARYAKGIKYLQGKKGVLEDYNEAFRWFKQAAMQGHAKSQYQTGLMYFNGSGVEQDLSEAYAWALLEAAGGSPKLKNKISSQLSEEQKMAGQIRAKELKEEMPVNKEI